jgi:hypothetical protein
MPESRRPFEERRSTLRAAHRRSLRAIAEGATQLASAAERIAQVAEEAHNASARSHIQVQPQINFLTGALARLIKDWGVLEHIQSFPTIQPGPAE